jgi:hypothetical protein
MMEARCEKMMMTAGYGLVMVVGYKKMMRAAGYGRMMRAARIEIIIC